MRGDLELGRCLRPLPEDVNKPALENLGFRRQEGDHLEETGTDASCAWVDLPAVVRLHAYRAGAPRIRSRGRGQLKG
jgi:hypothetical protein